MFLNIKDLSVNIDNKNILNKLNLTIKTGEIHAIMGPIGCGKSTLANVLAGKEDYEILSGEIIYKDKDLFELNIEERAQEGLFLAFQYPIEIPGVNITTFLHAPINVGNIGLSWITSPLSSALVDGIFYYICKEFLIK